MKGLSEKVVVGGFTLAILVLSGVAMGSYLSVQKLVASRQWVEHTFEVLEALNKTVDGTTAASSGRYGYVINLQKTYLEDYEAGLQKTEQGINTVRRLTIDNPEQQRRLTELTQLVVERNALLQRSIDLVEQGQSTEKRQTALSNQSWRLNREIRLKLDAMKDEERRLLQQRKAATDTSVQQAILVNGVGYLLGFSLLISIFWMLHRQQRIRQQAEAALQKHAEEVSDLYNHAPCGYHSLDAAGTFIRINDTELGWLGYTRDEVVDKKTFIGLITAQSALLFQENFPKFKKQGWISDIEFELVRKDGTLLPVSLSATAIKDAEGNFLMSRSTLFDISDRKRVQAALQQANEQLEARVQERTAELSQVNALLRSELIERKQIELALQQAKEGLEIQVQERTAALKQSNDDLQRSNQELEQFAYIASHDLQEPLRAIMGYTQLLTQDHRDRLDETAQGYGAYIVDGAKRMQQLIQDLLHYSRVGTRDLVFAPTDCNELLKQVLGNLQVAIAESNAAITYDPLPVVTADANQLAQLFQNLIGNAIKFCRDDVPTVHISARLVEEQETSQGGLVEPEDREILNSSSHTPHPCCLFSVCDNGIGIKPRYLERIFEIFKRLHTRTEFPGTGIGLAICKKIVDRHGGRIWAESQPNSGTTFYFTIPSHDYSNTRLDRDLAS